METIKKDGKTYNVETLHHYNGTMIAILTEVEQPEQYSIAQLKTEKITENEKDWEVKSYATYDNVVWVRYSGDLFRMLGHEKSESELIKHQIPIHTVLRKSDNSEFTKRLTYNVYGHEVTREIKGFEVVGNKMFVHFTDCDSVYLHHLSKPDKKPLFTTEDGFDIYKGDEYFYVPRAGQNLNWHKTKAEPNCGIESFNSARFKRRESAVEYINKNKPKYSEQQILEAFEALLQPMKDANWEQRYITVVNSVYEQLGITEKAKN